jgi:hypothetical protein
MTILILNFTISQYDYSFVNSTEAHQQLNLPLMWCMADSAVLTVTVSTRISDSAVSLIRIISSSYAAASQDEWHYLIFVVCANMNVPSQVK